VSEVSDADELPHAVGPETSWREAYRFELFDAASGLVGSASVDVRPNEGAMDVALTFYLEDGGFVTARHVAATSENTATLEIEDVRFTMLEPLRRWRIAYDGPCHALASIADSAKREAWQKSRLERLIVELEFAALEHPAVPVAGGFVQPGRWTGEVWVSGDRYVVTAPGVRSKAWGAVASPRQQRRFALSFGEDCTVDVVQTLLDDGPRVAGWIFESGRRDAIDAIELVTETEPGSYRQKAFRLTLAGRAGGRRDIAGDVVRLASLPGFRGGHETMLCDGVVSARLDGRSGFGVASYLHRLDGSGNPVEPVA
jgi:hypothetical protein